MRAVKTNRKKRRRVAETRILRTKRLPKKAKTSIFEMVTARGLGKVIEEGRKDNEK